jgi:hypothetical protein
MAAPVPENDRFYSRVNRAMAGVVWLAVALLAAGLLFMSTGSELLYLLPLACAALLAWEALWIPAVDVSDRGVIVTNPFRSISIPWTALVHVDTKYALTLYTPGHKYAAWAAPAPGRTAAYRLDRSEKSAERTSVPLIAGSARPGDLLGSESGQAAYLVRTRWSRLRAENRIPVGMAEQAAVEISWHPAVSAAVVALVAASVVAVLLG